MCKSSKIKKKASRGRDERRLVSPTCGNVLWCEHHSSVCEDSWKSPTYAGSLHCIIADNGSLISCLMVISLINIDNVDDQVLWQSQNEASSLYCTICRMIPFLHRKVSHKKILKSSPLWNLICWKFISLSTRSHFDTHIFDLCTMTWCALASSKQNFKKLQSSGEELLHNEAYSTSRITPLIFQ